MSEKVCRDRPLCLSARKVRKHESRGFTLLELMLAVLLLVSGFLSLSWALSAGLFAGGDNENTLTAINLAQEKMDEIRNKSYASLVNEAKAAVSGFSSFQRETAVSAIQSGLKQVNVNVYWYVKSAETSVGLVSYVSDI